MKVGGEAVVIVFSRFNRVSKNRNLYHSLSLLQSRFEWVSLLFSCVFCCIARSPFSLLASTSLYPVYLFTWSLCILPSSPLLPVSSGGRLLPVVRAWTIPPPPLTTTRQTCIFSLPSCLSCGKKIKRLQQSNQIELKYDQSSLLPDTDNLPDPYLSIK